MKRIALIEDDQLVLKRMAFFLNAQEELACTIMARSLGEFFECLDESQEPDLLLLDIELSDSVNTINHLRKVKSLLPNTRILIITGHNHPAYLLQALQKGADSFYLKGSGLPKLLEAVEVTFSGGAYLDPAAAAHMIPLLRNNEIPADDNKAEEEGDGFAAEGLPRSRLQLSRREQQVAEGLLKGRSYEEIARNINLSVNTVRHYVKVLYKKFGVANKIQLSNKLKPYI